MHSATKLWNCTSIAAGIFLCLGCTTLFAQTPCSLVKTNTSCTYTVDRSLPLTPPTIQMYPGQTVTIAITNAYTFEKYSLDWSAGTLTQTPDIGSAAFTALQPSLKNLTLLKQHSVDFFDQKLPPEPPTTCTADTLNKAIAAAPAAGPKLDPKFVAKITAACFARIQTIQTNANSFYAQLQVAIWPDSITAAQDPAVTAIALKPTGTSDDSRWEKAMVCELFGGDLDATGTRPLHGGIPSSLNYDCAQISPAAPFFSLYNQLFEVSSVIGLLNSTVNPANAAPIFPNQDVLDNLQSLADSKTLLDATRTDLTGYGNRLVSLLTTPLGHVTALGAIPVPPASRTQIPSVTFNVNALNVILNPAITTDNTKKKLVVAITVVTGDVRWEVSAGTFFSSLPVRSFAASPVFMSGTAGPAGTPDTVTDKKVTESDVRPLVIPFAAVSYRLSHDFTKPVWRQNFYWSFAVGINPNTITSDFATGPGWSYRGLVFNGFWHIGHDVRLIPNSGVKVGDSLGPSFSGSLPTENYWRFDSVGIGISIRTPSLTGR